jgi:uncharacterized ParB-like nuclease family protein
VNDDWGNDPLQPVNPDVPKGIAGKPRVGEQMPGGGTYVGVVSGEPRVAPDKVDNWETKHFNFGGIRKPGVVAGPNAGGFREYGSAEEGVGDIARLLQVYQNRHGLNTIRGIVSRWAPPSDNNPTAALIDRASKIVGVGPDDPVDLKDSKTLAKMIEATIRNEQGGKLPVDSKIIGEVAGAPDFYAPPASSAREKIADSALLHEQKIPNSRVYNANIADLLAALPDDTDTTENGGRAKGKSLRESVIGKGEPIMDLPHIDVTVDKNGKAKVTDYDGLHRLRLLDEMGYDTVPIAIHGIPQGTQIKEWQGLRGEAKPFAFQPLPPIPPPAPSIPQRIGTGIADVGVGAAQAAAHAGAVDPAAAPYLPPEAMAQISAGQQAQSFDKTVADREQQIEAERQARGETGTDWWRAGGNALGTLPLAAALIPATGGYGAAMLGGAIGGAATNALMPVTQGNFAAEKLKQLGFGGLAGTAGGAGGELLSRLISPPIRSLADQARQLLSQRFAERAAGSGANAGDILGRIIGARSEGQPMTLADIPELQGLAGAVSRATGEAGARIRAFFSGRQGDALRRLDAILARYLPTGSVKRTIEGLAKERSEAAAPVYEEAFAGGSIAPLEKQFQKEWNTAAGVAKNAEQTAARLENELNASLARQSQAGNVYSASSSNQATKAARAKIAEQRRIAAEARQAEQSALQRLRQAQQDGSANAPGAIWSPTIQRLIDNPRVKVGIRKGMQIERDLADAEGRPMRLSEYAVVGMDQHGDPVVGAVPNMKLLAAAKKGLDAMVADMRHTTPPWRLTEEGRAVDQLRRTLLDELYRLNPKYKEANEIWSGGAESIRALTDGQRALNRSVSVEDVRDQLAKLPEGAKDFYRLGVADDARKDLLNVALTSDKSKAIVNSEAAREKLRVIIGSPEAAERFIQAIENERTMFNTGRTVTGGSQTAERLAEDSGLDRALGMTVHGGHAAARLAHGNIPGALLSGLRALRELQKDNRLSRNPALANEVSKLLTDPGVPLSHSGQLVPNLPPQLRPFLQRAAAEAARRLAPPLAYQSVGGPR